MTTTGKRVRGKSRSVAKRQDVPVWFVRLERTREEWHVESPDVDTMLCGYFISLDEGAVRQRAPVRNLCVKCARALKRRSR